MSGATQPRLPSFMAVAAFTGGGVKSAFLRIRDFGTRDSPVDALRNRAGVLGGPGGYGKTVSRRRGRCRRRASVSVVLPLLVKETAYGGDGSRRKRTRPLLSPRLAHGGAAAGQRGSLRAGRADLLDELRHRQGRRHP